MPTWSPWLASIWTLSVIASDIQKVCDKAKTQGLKVEQFMHSINIGSTRSDLRIQLQTDERYQAFIPCAAQRTVLGHELRVARLEDVLRGKVWACTDETRRKSKRQKDLADIARIIESRPDLASSLPDAVRKLVE